MITYQHASFIKEALDSVLMQKVDCPYEICLGEDGSTDGTREICLEYARKHPDKIRLFLRSRTNPSRKSTKSFGRHNTASTFAACRGKYIALLEGDDYWLSPNKLQVQINTLESDPDLAACCHYVANMQNERPWEASIAPTMPVDMFSVESILRRDVANLHTSTWLLRRGKPMQWEGFRSSLFGDYPLFVWTLLQGKARVLPRIWSMYRMHSKGGFSPLSPEVRWRENVELWKCLKSIVPPELQSALSIGMSRTLTMHTNSLVKAGKYRLALGVLRENLSGIARMDCPAKERNRLRLLAIESTIIPHLAGLRRRWSERRLNRS
jgi:glycosyltransferase involved in cell wall biosynthesis